MHKFNRVIFPVLASLILFACAQVGSISGGERDVYAPKPKKDGIQPPSGTTNFNSKIITYQFDEYFKLNNPKENISILPSGPTLKTKIDKKKLTLEIEGELEKNTTYQITFNSAIKDNNEGNDSLVTYVFSTGDFIDSLKYAGTVRNAYSNEAVNQLFVGLYPKSDSVFKEKPLYFSKSNKLGNFEMSYIKPGEYNVFAFDDVNKDLKFQITEKVGFKSDVVKIDSSFFDSTAVLIFSNTLSNRISTKSYVFPNLIKLSSNYNFSQTQFRYDTILIDSSRITRFSTDSIQFIIPAEITSDFNIYVINETKIDTLNFRYNSKNNFTNYTVFPSNLELNKKQDIEYYFSDNITAIDTNLITLLVNDSTFLKAEISFKENSLYISLVDELSADVKLNVNPTAISFKNSQLKDTIKTNFIFKKPSDFGSISFLKTQFPEHSVLELIVENKVVKKISNETLRQNPLVEFLKPGEYSFRLILDENKNFKWDAGDIFRLKQAEKVLHFPQKTKIRANWETEVELEIAK